MKFIEAIAVHRICLLHNHTKQEALLELIDLISQTEPTCHREQLQEQIFYREQLMSTGIGLGIGVPHVRLEGVSKPFITIGVTPEGIEDYEAIDNQPVKIVVMIVAGKNQHKQYLELLANVIKVVKREGIIGNLLQATHPEEIYTLFRKEAQHD